MTPQERMVANQDFIDGIEVRIAAIERQLQTGARVEPVFIGCRESEIDFVWPMGFHEDQIRLSALRMRVANVKRLNPPEPEMPPMIHLFG